MKNNVQTADDSNFQTRVLDSSETVLVDFWAPWCGPCRMQGPVLEELAAEREDLSVVKVNVDESPKTAGAYGIRSIPTIAVFQKGQAVLGAVGLQNKDSLAQLLAEADKRNGTELPS